MGAMGIGHWIVVGLVVMVFFGRGKISEMMGDVAKGIKAFKRGMAEDETTPAAGSNPALTSTPVAPVEPVKTLEHQPAANASTPVAADRKVG